MYLCNRQKHAHIVHIIKVEFPFWTFSGALNTRWLKVLTTVVTKSRKVTGNLKIYLLSSFPIIDIKRFFFNI